MEDESSAGSAGPVTERSIAVLPFENLSGMDDDAVFVDGVHVEILTRLAGISDITPISRASVLGYRDAPKSASEVARDLGVKLVLEGQLQRTGDRIRFNVQLVDDSGRLVWAEPYDRSLTAENLFAIQSEIAQRVTRELGAEISPAELRRIDRVPTEDLEAYDYWVRGYHQINGMGSAEAAVPLYEQAIALDPEFAGAWSSLSVAYREMFWSSSRTDVELCERAEEALARAREIDPELPELHIDSGYYYYRCFLDYDRALASLEAALRRSPNNVEALEVKGLVLRRSGRIQDAIDAHLRAVELSPRYGDLHWHLKSSYSLIRDFERARIHAERAISLNPSNSITYLNAAWVYYRESADPRQAREVLQRAREAGIEDPLLTAWDAWLPLLEGAPQAAVAAVGMIPRDDIFLSFIWNPPIRTRAHLLARAHRLRGDRDREWAYLDSARVILTDAIETSDAPKLHSSLAVVLAELGLGEEAVREGIQATELLTLDMDAWGATYMLENLAWIHAASGDPDAAIDLLEQLLSIPGDLTRDYLARSPEWDALRDHPAFVALLDAGSP
jgi:TolB-like protein/Flp pilus assembly protein TadD